MKLDRDWSLLIKGVCDNELTQWQNKHFLHSHFPADSDSAGLTKAQINSAQPGTKRMDVSVAEIRMDLSGHYTFFLGIKISLYPKDRNTNCCFVAVVPSPETWKTYPINAPAVGGKTKSAANAMPSVNEKRWAMSTGESQRKRGSRNEGCKR